MTLLVAVRWGSVVLKLAAFAVGLVAADNSAIWQADASRRHFRTCAWRISEYGMEVEQVRPLSRVLGACDLPVRAIHDRVGTVS